MRYFVTATDTNVGKTYVLTLILKFLISKGIKPFAIKPIETGCIEKDGMLIPQDGLKIAQALDREDSLDDICPIRFKNPLSPYAAMKLEKKEIDLKKVKSIILKNQEPLFVEGAGGLMVPILKNYFMIDLAKELDLEVILISPLKLGTINHTLLSIEAMKRRNIKIKGIILNDNQGIEDIATKTNPEILKELIEEPILGVIPYKFDDFKNLDRIISL